MKKQNLNLFLLFFSLTVLFTACNSETKKEETATPDLHLTLAQWSLHKSFFGDALNGDWAKFGQMLMESPDSLLQGDLKPVDFPEIAASYGFTTIELVNTFYFSKAHDQAFWDDFKMRCEKAGVDVGLIMCDALGNIGDADSVARAKAVENHHAWVDIAAFLGAKSIRVNAAGQGTAEELAAQAADGLKQLATYAATKGINVIVENHGGLSSNGEWLAGVMKVVNMENVGTLPDFGNFCLERTADGCAQEYDRYKGIEELLPYAKGVSAKTFDFDSLGNESTMDYVRILKLMKDAGFKGNVGIEYEGERLSEDEGIKATKAMLDKLIAE